MDEPMIKHHYPAGLPENLRETWDSLAEIPLEDRALSRAEFCGGDLWGYGDAMAMVRREARALAEEAA